MSVTEHRVHTSAPSGEKLKDRVAFVTGGTRGIGAAIGLSLANQGATVAAGYGGDEEGAKGGVGQLKSQEGHGSIHPGKGGAAGDRRPPGDQGVRGHGRGGLALTN